MRSIRSYQKAVLGVLIFLLVGSPLALAQVTITGTVEESPGNPIANAVVYALDSTTFEFLGQTSTDGAGQFSLSVAPSTSFNIFIHPPSLPPGVIFPFPLENTSMESVFNSPASGSLNIGTFQGLESATITGTVEDHLASGVEDAFVYALDATTFEYLGGGLDGRSRAVQPVSADEYNSQYLHCSHFHFRRDLFFPGPEHVDAKRFQLSGFGQCGYRNLSGARVGGHHGNVGG